MLHPPESAGVERLAVGVRGRAAFDVDLQRLRVRLQHHVDHAGDGVRSVLRRRAVAKDLDVVDGRGGDGVEVDAARSAADRVVRVHERAGVAALAVDHDQELIGPQSAQRGRADGVGAVADRRPRKVERRRDLLNDLARLRRRRRGDLLLLDDVDRHGLLLLRADRARADRDLLAEGGTQHDLHLGVADGRVDGARLKALQRGGDLQLAALPRHSQRELPLGIRNRRDAHALDRNGDARKRAPVALQA